VLTDNLSVKLEIEEIKKKLENQDKNIELVFSYLDELIEKQENPLPRTQIGYKLSKKESNHEKQEKRSSSSIVSKKSRHATTAHFYELLIFKGIKKSRAALRVLRKLRSLSCFLRSSIFLTAVALSFYPLPPCFRQRLKIQPLPVLGSPAGRCGLRTE